MTKLNTDLVYLQFEVYKEGFVNIGSYSLPIRKKHEFEKFKNPELCELEVIQDFKKLFPEYINDKLQAIHTSDFHKI